MNEGPINEESIKQGPVDDAPTALPRPGGALRALVVGLVVALALGLTLLTWALSLMFMLGLFFFMLFGLLVGACMFRAGSRSRPMPKPRVIVVTAIVVLAGWLAALGKECSDFPDDFVESVVNKRRLGKSKLYIPQGGHERVCAEVRTFIGEYLAREYPPGGWVGYLRHAATGRPIALDIPSQPQVISVPARTAPWVWWTRGLLALPLFFLTTYSVTAGLTRLANASEKRRHY